ncbi:MAG: type II toxin-antitoxin system Phd/YefM family antitoxin [Micrococcales bacterium]|nr:type II toxin-antitoxin system Phd/YefM family antitoxin [Micrococcales bacterium]
MTSSNGCVAKLCAGREKDLLLVHARVANAVLDLHKIAAALAMVSDPTHAAAVAQATRRLVASDPEPRVLYNFWYDKEVPVSTISASEARQRLFPLLAQVNDDHTEIRITSKAGNGVLISEADFEAWQTTRYLFSTRANAEHLLESLTQAATGGTEPRELDRS